MSEKKKTLRMKFTTDEGKKVSVSLAGCKEGITAQDVDAAMDTMLANQIFVFGLDEKRGAAVIDTTVTELF
ncbi:MAG: DUF2922 domain-containing protein [Synergistaceae bacterium]|nr:DUF2922 domain-containing protein [Synergistaceae bacterium]